MAFINISIKRSVKVPIFSSGFLLGKISFSRRKGDFPCSSNILSPNSVKPKQPAKNCLTFCHPKKHDFFPYSFGVNFPTLLFSAVCDTSNWEKKISDDMAQFNSKRLCKILHSQLIWPFIFFNHTSSLGNLLPHNHELHFSPKLFPVITPQHSPHKFVPINL